MNIPFVKYSGTGNDFILIDDRSASFPMNDLELIAKMCDRHFGIGSDGLMLIRDHEQCDFEMIFFNPDGSKSMCGNGSRCAVHFAASIGLASDQGRFLTTDGEHEYHIVGEEKIKISMSDTALETEHVGHLFLNTGSPHLLVSVENVNSVDVDKEGRALREHTDFEKMNGTNINFIESLDENSLRIRTYERGVEGETLSCGTGVTAAALSYANGKSGDYAIEVAAEGGHLTVEFSKNDKGYQNIFLTGPVSYIFKGEFDA